MLSSILLIQDKSVSRSSTKGGLKNFCLNINSLTRVLDEIRIFVEDKQPHILCLNETKIDYSISDNDIEIEGYIVDRKDRNRFGGGVAIYIHSTIQFTLCEDLKDLDLETITVELNLPFTKPIVLTTLYRPEGPIEVFNRIESMVSNIVGNNIEFILIGDLNCDLLSGTASRTKHLVQIYNTYGLLSIDYQGGYKNNFRHSNFD